MPDDYYVVVTYGPYSRGQAQNLKWDLEQVMRDDEENGVVTIKHAAD
jgi:hypothetical protein